MKTEEKVKELIEEAIADAHYSNSCTTCPIVANNLKIASELLEKYFEEYAARDAKIRELLNDAEWGLTEKQMQDSLGRKYVLQRIKDLKLLLEGST